ncbi:MAG TPA: acyltransferase [Nitriliruptorales bacterium]
MGVERIAHPLDVAASRLVAWAWERTTHYGAVSPGRRSAARFLSLGEGSVIGFPAVALVGEDRTVIGQGCVIGPYATLCAGLPGQPPRPQGEAPRLVIGDRCWLGRGLVVNAHARITIGDDVWTGANVFVSDANHGWSDADQPIGRQFGTIGPVAIGAGSWLGHGVLVLPGASIGRRCVIGAGAVVRGDIPDGSIAVGVPARVVGRVDDDDDVHAVGPSVA